MKLLKTLAFVATAAALSACSSPDMVSDKFMFEVQRLELNAHPEVARDYSLHWVSFDESVEFLAP